MYVLWELYNNLIKASLKFHFGEWKIWHKAENYSPNSQSINQLYVKSSVVSRVNSCTNPFFFFFFKWLSYHSHRRCSLQQSTNFLEASRNKANKKSHFLEDAFTSLIISFTIRFSRKDANKSISVRAKWTQRSSNRARWPSELCM